MKEKSAVQLKKEEFTIKEYVKKTLGKGKVSKVWIEYTPIGEKIIISTHKPGLIIGRKGEKIEWLTNTLKNKFKLENPHIEISEIEYPELDAQVNADRITLELERFGPLRFKVIAYRALQRITDAGALGIEIRISGKLPGSRAKSWRFSQGYLKKTGDNKKIVDRAQTTAQTKPGIVGVKVSILSPYVKQTDRIEITDELIKTLKNNVEELNGEVKEKSPKLKKK
ncbi:30S ribosomal protein S3 [Candidatus Pacearchaeota archaeon]|nr:30S ribosomal protein S3 [Candidatus Pacearchaeota archaeon]